MSTSAKVAAAPALPKLVAKRSSGLSRNFRRARASATAPRRVVGTPEYIRHAGAPPPCNAPHPTPRADPPEITEALGPTGPQAPAGRGHSHGVMRSQGLEWTGGTPPRTPGTTAIAGRSSRRCTTSSAAPPSCTARRCTGFGQKTSGRFSTRTACPHRRPLAGAIGVAVIDSRLARRRPAHIPRFRGRQMYCDSISTVRPRQCGPGAPAPGFRRARPPAAVRVSYSERISCTRTSASLCSRSFVAVSNVTGPVRASSRR